MRLSTLAVCLTVSGLGMGCGWLDDRAAPAAAPSYSAAAQAAYQKNCRFCHGDDAKGNGKMAPKDSHPSDLTDEKWDRGSTDGEIFAVIRDGAGPAFTMKGYKGRMQEPDMWNIVNYLRTLGPQAKK